MSLREPVLSGAVVTIPSENFAQISTDHLNRDGPFVNFMKLSECTLFLYHFLITMSLKRIHAVQFIDQISHSILESQLHHGRVVCEPQ